MWALTPLLLALLGMMQLTLAVNYNNSNTAPYLVGNLRGLDFGLGESYSGLLPISNNETDVRRLFYWFFPTTNPAGSNEITIWFTGGPGCSSLEGLLTENGPFVWYYGSQSPSINPWAIRRLTNVLYVDQPIGTGFSPGTPDISDERDLAREFIGFYKNFADLFAVKDYKIYVAGESYAGYFVSYIADAFVNASSEYRLAGVSLTSPLFGNQFQQQETHLVPYALKWQDLLLFNQTTISQLQQLHTSCSYSDYIDKWFRFPALQQPMPTLDDAAKREECDVWTAAANAATDSNPCFNVYHVPSFCPQVSSAILDPASPDSVVPGNNNYFNRTDVKLALHVPEATDFIGCTHVVPFKNSQDLTANDPPATDGTLTRVIDTINNVMISSGHFDFSLNYNGTLMAIQNITWGGKRGFDQYPAETFFVPRVSGLENTLAQAQAGEVGTWVSERGLTYFSVKGAGHEIWTDSPAATFRSFEVLLGRRSNLSSTEGYAPNIWGTT